jgi:hypothetical protein
VGWGLAVNKKELAQKIMQFEFDGETCEFFAQGARDGKGWVLFVKSSCPMKSDDVLQALDVFMAEVISQEMDLMDSLAFTPGDH